MYNLYRVGLLKVDPAGLIEIRHCDVKGEEFDAISVPEEMYPGIVTALHIQIFTHLVYSYKDSLAGSSSA